MYCCKIYIHLIVKSVLKLQWCVKMAKMILMKKRLILLSFCPNFKIQPTWRNTRKWYFDKNWNYLPFQILFKRKGLLDLIFFKNMIRRRWFTAHPLNSKHASVRACNSRQLICRLRWKYQVNRRRGQKQTNKYTNIKRQQKVRLFQNVKVSSTLNKKQHRKDE